MYKFIVEKSKLDKDTLVVVNDFPFIKSINNIKSNTICQEDIVRTIGYGFNLIIKFEITSDFKYSIHARKVQNIAKAYEYWKFNSDNHFWYDTSCIQKMFLTENGCIYPDFKISKNSITKFIFAEKQENVEKVYFNYIENLSNMFKNLSLDIKNLKKEI